MKVRAVDFIGIAVHDMGEAQSFYRDTLGLAPGYESDGWAEYEAGNVTLSLIAMPASDTVGGTGWKNAVVALAVPDIEEALSELREKGVTVVEDTTEYPPCFMASIEDPFGNRIMLHQRKDGSAG